MNENTVLMYALALHSLAKDENNVADMKRVVNDFEVELNNEPQLHKLLLTPSITKDEKDKIIETILSPYNEPTFTTFIKLLSQKRVVSLYSDIAHEFNKLADETLQILHGLVYSAFPLDEKTIAQIEESITLKTGNKVKLLNKVDESLIGGVKVIVADQIFDGSIATQLEELKKNLISKKGVN
jgi:F-type H+-transporting ATPase subunit delta